MIRILNAEQLLDQVSEQVAPELQPHVVVIGSIASAWHFRSELGNGAVATKDIDLLLRPAVMAQSTASTLGSALIDAGWRPRLTPDRPAGTRQTPVEELPALRLYPPGRSDGWFIELLAEPMLGQQARRGWQAFETSLGVFGLPSFRQIPVAVHEPTMTPSGLCVAHPANMALAHLLEHADPDRTPISNLVGTPPRFVKDVGRAVSLAWLAFEQDAEASELWPARWRDALIANGIDVRHARDCATDALKHLMPELRLAHTLTQAGLLQARTPDLEALRRASSRLAAWLRALD